MHLRLAGLLCSGWLLAIASPQIVLAEKDATPARPTALGVIEDFDALSVGPFQKGFLDSWRWSKEQRDAAQQQSQLEIVKATGDGRELRVRIDDPALLAREPLPIARFAPYFPPEADAVRLRVKVISGQAVLQVGGPTAYFGNSDVFTEPHVIRATAEPQWVDVVCNLNHPTWRNYRRSGFSTDAPRNYYNRWAQEPIGVYLVQGTEGAFVIDRIDLVALGEGRPFATFTPDQIRPGKSIADFEDRSLSEAFNLYMADGEAEWFEQSWKREKPLRFAPHALSIAATGLSGKQSLACVGRTAEEVQCTGVRTTGDAASNAFAIEIEVAAPGQTNTLVGGGPIVPIDFLIFVAPPARPFPWSRFAPSEALRAHPGPGFDYQFSYRAIRGDQDVDFALYHARRYLTPGVWTKLIVPAADFTCVYGHGDYRQRLLEQQPLTCDDVIAVAWLNPWPRVGQRDALVTTRIDAISFVHVPGSLAELRSFWQAPDVKALRYRDGESPRGTLRRVALPSDAE